MGNRQRAVQIATPPSGPWVQTERAAHERWATLAKTYPKASAVLHTIVANMQRHNALMVSQKNLARMCEMSHSTLKRALRVLRDQNWIEIRQVGPTGTACAYIVNDRVAWHGPRDGIRYSLFSADILVSDDEQPDQATLDGQPALEQIPSMQPGEQQLPTGPGEDPPAEPPLAGLEPDLPARGGSDDT